MLTRIGDLEVTYSARDIPTYRIELWHDGLKKHRLIRGAEPEIVRRKAELQTAEWAAKWSETESRDQERRTKATQKQLAADRTSAATRELDGLTNILQSTLKRNHAIDWDNLKDKQSFPEPKPKKAPPPSRPTAQPKPREPLQNDSAYQPKLGFFDKLLSSRRTRILADCQAAFDTDHQRWELETQAAVRVDAFANKKYLSAIEEHDHEFNVQIAAWQARQAEYFERQRLGNETIDKQRAVYLTGAAEAVTEYCDLVLSRSPYPDYFPKEFELDYDASSKMLIVDYSLPAPEVIPTLKEVKYVTSKDDFVEQHLSQSQLDRLYDDALYQTTLRTVHELFESDVIGAIGTIVFNGIVTSIDRSTGKQVTACVLSLQAQRDEFLAIDLGNVDPKVCFKALKGVGSSKLHGLAPVPPIMKMRRDDARFIAAYAVAHTLDASSNLAAMDWEDFEHLIREVFEKEFSSNGGEVKVTQASRDGGVDAVAFDPDPIRGGKIVIQAKRYTNTVGVSAVRDLYGTVMNEGANKGILVTTSDYGPDAYAFANGKPLVLLSGANLLHMLEKHGHKARIDLQEARQIAMSQPAR